MSESTSETKSSVPSDLDERMKRFDERMAEDADPEHVFTKLGTLDAATKIVQERLDAEEKHFKTGHFHMAAQEQTQREIIREFTLLIEDLQHLKNILVASDD